MLLVGHQLHGRDRRDVLDQFLPRDAEERSRRGCFRLAAASSTRLASITFLNDNCP